jgi:hypothetical protein
MKIMAFVFLITSLISFDLWAGLKKKDVTTWPKTSVTEFGCFLEKQFGHKDEKFNCSLKKYVNKGDPCLNTVVYYEGPKFPDALAKKVDRQIQSIDLIWEHGKMQSVALTLDNKYPEKVLRKKFKLPATAQIDDCGPKNTCITVTGFDHIGAGDADCGDE